MWAPLSCPHQGCGPCLKHREHIYSSVRMGGGAKLVEGLVVWRIHEDEPLRLQELPEEPALWAGPGDGAAPLGCGCKVPRCGCETSLPVPGSLDRLTPSCSLGCKCDKTGYDLQSSRTWLDARWGLSTPLGLAGSLSWGIWSQSVGLPAPSSWGASRLLFPGSQGT